MKNDTQLSSFSMLVQQFFQHYLPIERNLSPNTVLSYRDTLKLLLRFVAETEQCSPDALGCEVVLDTATIRAFLRWLSTVRRCAASTRNQRLAAIKTFARYVAFRAPEHLDRCRQIREIQRARVEKPQVEFLQGEEMRRLVVSIKPGRPEGRRDRALLLLFYNSGARVQEVCDLAISDLRLEITPCIRFVGKGRKERYCPLWPKTVEAIRAWLAERGDTEPGSPLFLNARGGPLTRSGVRYVLTKLTRQAGLKKLDRARRITPHVIRHTTAMHMLQAKVDLTVIASWLGHSLLSTTHGYVVADMRMKQEATALASMLPELREGAYPSEDLVAWLDQLGRRRRYAQPSSNESGSGASSTGEDRITLRCT